MPVRSGPMRTFGSFEHQSTATLDSRGQADGPWNEITKAWVELKPLTGAEGILARQQDATLSHRLTVHWSPEAVKVTPRDRFRVDDRIFGIATISNPGDRNDSLEMIVRESV